MSSKRLYLDAIFSGTNKKESFRDDDDYDDIITSQESDEEYEEEDIESVDATILDRIFDVKHAETKSILEQCRNQELEDIITVKRMRVDRNSPIEELDEDNTDQSVDDFESMMLKERDDQIESKRCIYETMLPESKDLDLFYSNSITDCDPSNTSDSNERAATNRSFTWDKIHEDLGIKVKSQMPDDVILQSNTSRSITIEAQINEIITQTSNQSDAVLDCPSCMTRVTNNCQRHVTYKNHYRAMFVNNCHVDFTKEFIVKQTQSSRRRAYRVKVPSIDRTHEQKLGKEYNIKSIPEDSNSNHSSLLSTVSDDDSIFYRVRCETCSTLIGMLDRDEVYHFYNVIASFK